MLALKAHHLLGEAVRQAGDGASAADHQGQAQQILDEIRKKARSDAILARHDLSGVQKTSSLR